MSWFVAYTRPRAEFRAQEFYSKMGITSYVPAFSEERQWSDRLKKVKRPAISGYVFILLDKLNYEVINSNPFTRSVVKNDGAAVEIQNKEIEVLKTALDKGLVTKADFACGDLVYIQNGPFKNKKGMVELIEKNTIVLLLNKVKVKLSLAKSRLSLAG
ncbi:MAG: transcription termination/antitermination NusG family protein [Bacteroidota bacterium]|nr:transcription termination/antitermination NusG family protein [Bacteroidota bacterium]